MKLKGRGGEEEEPQTCTEPVEVFPPDHQGQVVRRTQIDTDGREKDRRRKEK
jgi:hypothetical protein